MQLVGTGGKGGIFHAKGIVVPWVLCVLRSDIVYRLVVLGVAQGDFVGGDAHDRAVFLVQEPDLLVEATAVFEAVVGLVEEGESCKLGAWDVRERVEAEAVDDDAGDVGGDEHCSVDHCLEEARVALEPQHDDRYLILYC